MPVTIKLENVAAQSPIPTENTLDPGETIVPAPAFDIIDQAISLSESAAKTEISSSTATLIIGAILIYFLIKIVFRFLPWILGITAIVIFIKAYGSA